MNNDSTNHTIFTTIVTQEIIFPNAASYRGVALPGIMSNEIFDMLVLIVGIIIIFLISALGTVLNIINIIVFIKQGLKDAVTITLFGLAVSDLGSVFTLLLQSGAYILHFYPHLVGGIEIRYLTGFLNWPHATFVRVACLMTVFVALERCLCVVIPLHVHRIITPLVAKIYNVFILSFIICIFVTLYYYSSVRQLFLPHLNRSVLGIAFTPAGRRYAIYMSLIVGSIYISSFILVAILSAITSIKLKQQSKWRKQMTASTSASGNQGEALSQRNRKVVKMVVVICIIFITCTAPGLVNTILYIVFPNYKQMRRYDNMYSGTSMINFALEACNSTANFFIYYYMSSNFTATFNQLMGRNKAVKT